MVAENQKPRLMALAVSLAVSCMGTFLRSVAHGQVADGNQIFYSQPIQYDSYLVGYGANANVPGQGEVSGTQFGNWIHNALDPNGVSNIHDADFFFQQCYGGGMLSDLVGALGTTPWVGASASSWWQVALATPSPAPGFVQPQYATWSATMVPQLYYNPNRTILQDDIIARNTDFFGPGSSYYRETPNYTSYNAGNQITLADAPVTNAGGTHYAVIFVGDTGLYGTGGDFTKLGQSMRNVSADLIKTLSSAWAGTNFQIYLLFGDGSAATLGFNTASSIGSNLLLNNYQTITNPANNYRTTVLAGTPGNLQNTLTAIGAAANPDSQFLFYGFDHGDIHNNFVVNNNPGIIPAINPASPGGSITPGNSYAASFSLEDPNLSDPNPNPSGEVKDTTMDEDSAVPPNLVISYSGLDLSATGEVDVLINGNQVGTLDPSTNTVTLDIPASFLQDADSVDIQDNSNEPVTINTETFDAGALPPEDNSAEVPEPAGFGIVIAVGSMLALRRRALLR